MGANDNKKNFHIYVTHVDSEGPFLKISGQSEKQSALMIETHLEASKLNLEKGIGAVHPSALLGGVVCAAKYKDGSYYRAKIINLSNIQQGAVGVHFIDYGNKDIIPVNAIRTLENYPPILSSLPGQATDFLLARIMQPSGRWEEPKITKLQCLLCYAEYYCLVETRTPTHTIIAQQWEGKDLSEHLVALSFGIRVPLQKQELLLQKMTAENVTQTNWQSNMSDNHYPPDHAPFLGGQSFPSTPSSFMRMQPAPLSPFNRAVMQINNQARLQQQVPTPISQRLSVHKAPRNIVNLKPLGRTPVQSSQIENQEPLSTPVKNSVTPKLISPKKIQSTYKSRLLEVNSQHQVYVSHSSEGPELFAIQLCNEFNQFEQMMAEINKRPHKSLVEPPMIGSVCLGRMSIDRVISRAVVMSLSGSQCKLFFVDYGETEMVSYYDIFDIPEEFIKPNVFALRFCLSGVKQLKKGPQVTNAFEELVEENVLTLRVVQPEGPPLIQYGQLYLNNKSILDILKEKTSSVSLNYKNLPALPVNNTVSVLVSYVDSCQKFYVQQSANIDSLNSVMADVEAHCEKSKALPAGELTVGSACCAQFPDDKNWYRAKIVSVKGTKILVSYVDYGNEQEVGVEDLRSTNDILMQLPAQAMKCALQGYEDKPIEQKTSNQLEMLALEKTLNATIHSTANDGTMVVDLVDLSVHPPLDVAKRMAQLSQPRSLSKPNIDMDKVSKPSLAPQSKEPSTKSVVSSPEGSIGDDQRKREDWNNTRSGRDKGRDKGNDRTGGKSQETNQRSFEKSAQQDKWVGNNKQERGDRRKPQKSDQQPYERRNVYTESFDKQPPNRSWELGSDELRNAPHSTKTANPRADRGPPRQRRDNRPPRSDWGDKNSWDDKRPPHDDKKFPRDDKKFPRDDKKSPRDNSKASWDDKKTSRDDRWEERPERPNRRNDDWSERGNRADNKDHRTQNRGERNTGRPDHREHREKSNFTPRDRANGSHSKSDDGNRSIASNKSDRSDKFNHSNSPYRVGGKHSEPRNKTLPNPISLNTVFLNNEIVAGSQHEITVTWFVSPENFYLQIVTQQPEFFSMMQKIPEIYKGVKPFSGDITVGSSVLAKYPDDGVLYRATVLGVQPFGKFIVQYIDFGNKFVVHTKDIWQLEEELMSLPRMAVHCSLDGVAPLDGEWKSNPELDNCFNAPRFQAIFQECVDEKFKVSLWNNGAGVSQLMAEKELCMLSDQQTSVTLKDEPIDLNIVVGQQMIIRVRNVESMEKFYIQLDPKKADFVEAAIQGFDQSKLENLSADLIVNGTHCIVKCDNGVCRAIITDDSDVEQVVAILPDYGHVTKNASKNFMALPADLSVYYYQSVECNLNNYGSDSNKLMTDDEFVTKLKENKFIVYINNIENGRLITTLYDVETGAKVKIFEPDGGAYEFVPVLCPRSVYNDHFGTAFISHVESLNEVYIQKATDTDEVASLLDRLYKFYEEGETAQPVEEFVVDNYCVAKSSDGNWYRAVIISVESDQCDVQFVDYGNSEKVPVDSVKKLDPQFHEPHSLALAVSLGLVALSEDGISKLLEITTDNELQVTVSMGVEGWLASLHLDGTDLAVKLIDEKLATPKQVVETIVEHSELTETPSQPMSIEVQGSTLVYISHIDSPGQFWLQYASSIEAIDELQALLQSESDIYDNLLKREMGTLCVAKYSADDQWYRAEVLDADGDITTVRFIDYGNTDVLDNVEGLLKIMPEKLVSIERYVVKSSVNAIPTGTGQWTEPASDLFTELVGDLSKPVSALIILKDVTTYVDLYVNGENVTDKLVSNGFATKSEENDFGDLASCFASHVNTPSEFWIQLESSVSELETVEVAMADAENFPELKDLEEGVICAAKYPEDGAWYRAQIITNGTDGTEVLFMDYGNASLTTELRSLPEELKTKPALSRKCALQKPQSIKVWSQQSELKFTDLAAEGASIFNIQFIASGDISIVELFLEGKSVTEELITLCENTNQSERPSPIGQDIISTGSVIYSQSPADFYILLEDSQSTLEEVTKKLKAAEEEFEVPSELKVGTLCAALWPEDTNWYRAKVLEFCDNGMHLLFIDFGNKAKCEEVRELPQELSEVEPLAKHCTLFAQERKCTETVKAVFQEIVENGNAVFQVEFLDSNVEPALVKLVHEGDDVSKLLEDAFEIETDLNKNADLEGNDLADNEDSTKTMTDQEENSASVKIENDTVEEALSKNADETSVESTTAENTVQTAEQGSLDVPEVMKEIETTEKKTPDNSTKTCNLEEQSSDSTPYNTDTEASPKKIVLPVEGPEAFIKNTAKPHKSETSTDLITDTAKPDKKEASPHLISDAAKPDKNEALPHSITDTAKPDEKEASQDSNSDTAKPGKKKASPDSISDTAKPGKEEALPSSITHTAKPNRKEASSDSISDMAKPDKNEALPHSISDTSKLSVLISDTVKLEEKEGSCDSISHMAKLDEKEASLDSISDTAETDKKEASPVSISDTAETDKKEASPDSISDTAKTDKKEATPSSISDTAKLEEKEASRDSISDTTKLDEKVASPDSISDTAKTDKKEASPDSFSDTAKPDKKEASPDSIFDTAKLDETEASPDSNSDIAKLDEKEASVDSISDTAETDKKEASPDSISDAAKLDETEASPDSIFDTAKLDETEASPDSISDMAKLDEKEASLDSISDTAETDKKEASPDSISDAAKLDETEASPDSIFDTAKLDETEASPDSISDMAKLDEKEVSLDSISDTAETYKKEASPDSIFDTAKPDKKEPISVNTPNSTPQEASTPVKCINNSADSSDAKEVNEDKATSQ